MPYEGDNMKLSKLLRKDKKKYIPELQLIPFIDILFVLLAFFMMTTTFDKEASSSIKIQLPNSTVKQVTINDIIAVSIDENKKIFINNSEVKIEELETKLKTELTSKNRNDVVIRADKFTDYGFVVKIMTIAKNAGAQQLDIATEKEE